MADPLAHDWDEALEANRSWADEAGIRAWSDSTDLVGIDPAEPFFRVLCRLCGFRVHAYSDLKRRYDGVLVCHNCWDPEPRNYRSPSKSKRARRPKTAHRKGALTFGDDFEGR